MKSVTVARNYAEALFAAGQAKGGGEVERFGMLIDAVAGAVAADERIAVALESPRPIWRSRADPPRRAWRSRRSRSSAGRSPA